MNDLPAYSYLDDAVRNYRDEPDSSLQRQASVCRMSQTIGVHWTVISPDDWVNEPVPEREWIVPDMIPANTVTLLAGEGAAGKSTLALQLAAARALGKPWLSTVPTAGRTLFLSAEDDGDELHRRMEAIRSYHGVSFADLSDICFVDLVGQDAVLGSLSKTGKIEATHIFKAMLRAIELFEPGLVIIDALADVFAGDENNRGQARQFISLLVHPASLHDCAFLVLSHPSLTGLANGTGASGNTAWGNSVRSRLFFEKAKAKDGTEPDPDLRTLTVNKSNYGPAGTTLTLKWERGVYVVQGGVNSLDKRALENRADETFLELLAMFEAQGQNASPHRSTSYAPAVFAAHPAAKGIGKRQFEAAMQRHLAAKKVRIETSGPPSKQRSRLVLVTTDDAHAD